jgi:hypothetical protein
MAFNFTKGQGKGIRLFRLGGPALPPAAPSHYEAESAEESCAEPSAEPLLGGSEGGGGGDAGGSDSGGCYAGGDAGGGDAGEGAPGGWEGAPGSGGGGGEGGGDDSGPDDSDPDDGPQEDTEKFIFDVFYRLINFNGRSYNEVSTVEVSVDDTVATLRAIISERHNVRNSDQVILLDGIVRLGSEFLIQGANYTMRTRISGGGKRAAGGGAKTQGKEAEMAALKEPMNMLLMRLQNNLNASPLFSKISEAVMKQNEVSEDITCDFLDELLLERGLNSKALDKLLTITAVSTRKEERCRQITAILFAGEIAMLSEMGALTASAKTSLELSVQLVISKMFMDPSGLLAWEKFVSKVGAIIKKKAATEAASEAASEVLPMVG